MIDKTSVMVYSAMICAFCLLAAGFLADCGMRFTALALLGISLISLAALLITWLGEYFCIDPDHDVVPGSTPKR